MCVNAASMDLLIIVPTLLIIVSTPPSQGDHLCTSTGYFPDSDGSCVTFYRCTDLWADGTLQTYQFTCPPGTVFDQLYSVCNWPSVVPGCALSPAPDTVLSTTEQVYTEHVCTEPGIFKHEDDCHKFWLCKEQKTSTKLKVGVEG